MEENKVGRPSRFGRVCVFCGSSPGKRNCYQDAAVELGKELVARKVGLVYGGGSVGLMGLVSEAVHQGGGHVIGIIPRTLMCKEITGETIGEVRPVASMHQRKAEMARYSDAFIALPGGYGTLEELLEVITWAQLGIHSKPVGLLNVDGYYDKLLAFIDKAVDDGFIQPIQRRLVVSASNAGDLVQKLEVMAALLLTYLPCWPPSLLLYALNSTPNTDWSCRNTSRCRTTWLRGFAGRWSRLHCIPGTVSMNPVRDLSET
ncbi:unnamed protein product [Musa textilis]